MNNFTRGSLDQLWFGPGCLPDSRCHVSLNRGPQKRPQHESAKRRDLPISGKPISRSRRWLVGGGRIGRPVFFEVFKPSEGFVQVLFALGGGGGGHKNDTYCVHAPINSGIYSVFTSLYNTRRKGCGTRHVVTSVHAFGEHAQNNNICCAFASLYDILHKDEEQGRLSQASMPSATMSKALVFTALLFLYGLRIPG